MRVSRSAMPRMLRLVGASGPATDRLALDVRLSPPGSTDAAGRDGSGQPAADPRHATARAIAQLAMDLYLDGSLGFEDSAMLGFQADLNRRFAPTIGALTGEVAAPDGVRDYVALWEERLAFERRHNPDGIAVHQRMARIIAALNRHARTAFAAAE